MSILRFQIQHANGRQEQVTVEAERALIGSGAHCEIRLPIDQAQVEHILITVGAGGVFAQALSFEPQPTIANVPFQQAPLPPDAVLGVTGTQMLVSLVGEGVNVSSKPKQKTNPMLILAALVAVAFGAYTLLFADQEQGMPEPKDAPKLWEPAPTTCAKSGEQAVNLANEKRIMADSKRERRMFHVRDGVDAVPLYEQAAACYEKGGDKTSATQSQDAAKELRAEMDDDYRTRRMRLQHALTVKDMETARKEVKTLLELLADKQGPYIDYLHALDRELKQKLGRAPS